MNVVENKLPPEFIDQIMDHLATLLLLLLLLKSRKERDYIKQNIFSRVPS